MNDKTLIGPWIRRFLLEYLVTERNLARNTQTSYRDTLVLLLPFLSKAQEKAVDRLTIDDLSPTLVSRFLEYLENERGCCGATRNLRLATIHSLARFIGLYNPEYIAWSVAIRTIPFKKTTKSPPNYLDKPEIDALLQTPDLGLPQGQRDYALLLFLYNTGARVIEAAHLTVADITWGRSPAVRLVGKGSKIRWCPLWRRTAGVLKLLVAECACENVVFLNRLEQPLTRLGIYRLVQCIVQQASQTLPSLAKSGLAHIVSGIPVQSICYVRAWVSTPFEPGLVTFPWIPRISIPKWI